MHAPDLTLWDAATGNKIATLATPPGKVRDVRFLTDEWLLEVRGETLLARHLAGDRSKVVELGKAAADPFESPFALSGDGKTLAANDGTKATVSRVTIAPTGVTLTPTGAAVEKLSGDAVLALSHDGGLLAVFTGGPRVNRLLTVYDAATGAVRHHLRWRADPEGPNPATALCFLPDGQTLAVAEPKSVRLYDLASGRERGFVPVGWPRALAASPDGKTLAAATRYESGLRLWDIAALK
jgi:WD40 repeat protein